MAKPNIGTMIVDGDLYTMIGVAEFQHVIKEVPYNVELYVKKVNDGEIVYSAPSATLARSNSRTVPLK